jgi:hypothetical protein
MPYNSSGSNRNRRRRRRKIPFTRGMKLVFAMTCSVGSVFWKYVYPSNIRLPLRHERLKDAPLSQIKLSGYTYLTSCLIVHILIAKMQIYALYACWSII